jgi:two-component sensor histidine kinase
VNQDPAELKELFHTLNNQLGIILSHAELLEAKAQDETQKARATLVVTTTLEALATARQIRLTIEPVRL